MLLVCYSATRPPLSEFSGSAPARSVGSWCVKGTEESTSSVDSSVPLTHHDPNLGLTCLVLKRKIHFRILSDLKRILSRFSLLKSEVNAGLPDGPISGEHKCFQLTYQ